MNYAKNNIITEKEKQSIYLKTLYNYTKSEIWKQIREAKKSRKRKAILYNATSK